jgi:hypothetical protein
MEHFLYGIGVGIGITIITLITISHYLFPTKKPNDNEWEA